MSTERFFIDGLPVSSEEAATALVHHLRLAAMFFEPIGDEDAGDIVLAELNRRMIDGDRAEGRDAPAYRASLAFIKEIVTYYDMLRDELG